LQGDGGSPVAREYFCASVGAVDEETIQKYIESQRRDEAGLMCCHSGTAGERLIM